MRNSILTILLLPALIVLIGACTPPAIDCYPSDGGCDPVAAAELYGWSSNGASAPVVSGFLAITNDTQIYKSTTAGDWTSFPYTGTGGTALIDIAISGTTLYGVHNSTASTVYKSTDFGETWTALSTGSGFAHTFVTVCDSGRILTLFNNGSSTEASFSDDEGATWQTGSSSIVAASPVMRGLHCKGGRAVAYHNFAPRAEFSTDEGNTWANGSTLGGDPINQAVSSDGNTAIAFYTSGSLTEQISTDGGANYSSGETTVGTMNGGMIHTGSQFVMTYTSSPNCVFFKSATGGTGNWTSSNVSCGASAQLKGGASSSDGNDIVFGGNDGGGTQLMVSSHDGGGSFAQETLPAAGSANEVRQLIYASSGL